MQPKLSCDFAVGGAVPCHQRHVILTCLNAVVLDLTECNQELQNIAPLT
ncbi:MAG: hypothetical protein ACJAZ2_000726 [Glaciecola sp.]|jgi:hypothetical protein